ncbi:MAG: hypothetical protein HZA66_05875 [Rhodopseudomonas palustris]|uniref:Uncharacterized protein n=1 Tax=Rhodopseudomonas palustris TaxID=1076 RepID=A0A933RVF8_RHOPL|nr:hypothetical protein [Rhodopseudomonas palustris]
MLTTKGRGLSAAEVTESDATNLLLASVLEFARGADVAAEVRRVRELPLVGQHYAKGGYPDPDADAMHALQFLAGLSIFGGSQAGEALDSIFADMRSGAFEKWSEGVPIDVIVNYHAPNDRLMVFIDRPHFRRGVMLSYGSNLEIVAPVEQITKIHRVVFADIAAKMGAKTNEARTT